MLVSRSTALSLDSLMPLVNACVLQDATAGTHFSAYPTEYRSMIPGVPF